MARVEFVTDEGIIRVKVNQEVTPYLLRLHEAGNYTGVDVQTLLDFKNPKAAHLFSMLESWKNLGKGENFAVQTERLENPKLRLLEDASLYPIFGDFKRRVLKPVFADFARLGYEATWSASRTGKKTTGVTFTIPRALRALAASSALPATALAAISRAPTMHMVHEEPTIVQAAGWVAKAEDGLTKLLLTPAQIRKVLEVVRGDENLTMLFKLVYPLLSGFHNTTVTTHNRNIIAGLTVKLLKSNCPTLYAAWPKD